MPFSKKHSQLISDALRGYVLEMTINVHGNHVVQMCLDFLCDDDSKQPIYDAVLGNCGLISTDKHGCCVMQKLLNTSALSIKVK